MLTKPVLNSLNTPCNEYFCGENNMKNANHQNRKSAKTFSLRFNLSFLCILMFGFILMYIPEAQEYTRGIGVYPGDVREDFSPKLRIDEINYRNMPTRAVKNPGW